MSRLQLEEAGTSVPGAAMPASPWSWDDVVRVHRARVYRHAYRLTGNVHDAQDLTQDVFVRAIRHENDSTPGNVQGWLYRITRNLFLDHVRRQRRLQFLALPENAEDRIAGAERTPAEELDERTFSPEVDSALHALQPPYRSAVMLCDVEGLSYLEIAAALGIQVGTVRSRLHRGRAQLRRSLDQRAPRRQGSRPVDADRTAAPADGARP